MNETTCIPPVVNKRNEYGLLCNDDIKYIYDPTGHINWRAMIDTDFLVANSQKTTETDINKLKDSELIILLGGLKKLATIRGYKEVHYATSSDNDRVISVCKILWIGNYETENHDVVFSAVGDATPDNTSGFGSYYLGAISENRAFARCVRNFLRIHIVSDEEIGGGKSNKEDATTMLAGLMREKSVSFSQVKRKLISRKVKGAEDFLVLEDIPKLEVFDLIGRLSKKA